MKLSDINFLLGNEEYFYLGHGTGRNNSNEVVPSIFKNGLRTKNNSLYYTAIGLDTTNIEELETKLNNWPHLESKNIILIRVPIKYINMYGESSDLDGEKFGAFYQEINGIYYLKPKFIIGCYSNGYFIKNPLFEENLSLETIQELESSYQLTLKKTKDRLKRLEDSFPFGR